MSEQAEPSRVKLRADVTTPDDVTCEAFWAEPLGDDLYRLDSIPFYAYDIHYQDVVRAVAQEPGQVPTILEAVQPSGHKTLRVLFDGEVPEEEVQRLLDNLASRHVQTRHAHGTFYALNVPPEGDYQSICTLLWNQENAGWLTYETGTTPPA